MSYFFHLAPKPGSQKRLANRQSKGVGHILHIRDSKTAIFLVQERDETMTVDFNGP